MHGLIHFSKKNISTPAAIVCLSDQHI